MGSSGKPEDDLLKLQETFSPIERALLPHLKKSSDEIKEKTNLDDTSLLRGLRFLENKGILKVEMKKTKLVTLGTNGVYYKKQGLPERNLLHLLDSKNYLTFEEAKNQSKLSENEFKVSLGILKEKALISIKNGKLVLSASKEELARKSFEERLLDDLPLNENVLKDEQLLAYENLKKRKDILLIEDKQEVSFQLTELGKKFAGKELHMDLVEEVTSEVIKNWSKGKKFRRYDITSEVPKLNGGKRHFVNQASDYARGIWTDMGFKEMVGPKVDTSFWVFDALFTPQDHPAREMQDTFFISKVEGKLPENKALVKKIKESHETGLAGSKGWNYQWTEQEAKKVLLRTHTTAISSRTLSTLKTSELPKKFFALGRCFRNETVDWSHGFEFNQTEGIVIDKNANFGHLLGYLQEFFKKMGYPKVLFRPSFFAYTEPSVEIAVWHPERKVWLELGGAGMFRPEVTIPLLGEHIPVLAWGPGFDRTIMEYCSIKDFREIYGNDLKQLREMRSWVK